MDFSKLSQKQKTSEGEYHIVKPGITLSIFYSESIETLGTYIADILEDYVNFIVPNKLETYYASNGTWKQLSGKIFTYTLKALRSLPEEATEFYEFHFGQLPEGSVGAYAAHLKASSLANEKDEPLETNWLLLEFPEDFLNQVSSHEFVQFVLRTANRRKYNSGISGYAFKQPFFTFEYEASIAIARMAMRYIGFDLNNDFIRYEMKDHIYNVSWLNLFGEEIVSALGGVENIKQQLPRTMEIIETSSGILIQIAKFPIIGDVNRKVSDLEPLKQIAAITKTIRVEEADCLNIDDDDSFAERWLSRFD